MPKSNQGNMKGETVNRTEWEQHVSAEWERLTTLRKAKSDEYVRDETDILINFKKGADFQRVTPERALLGVMSKHITSTVDFIHEIDKGKCEDYEKWQEKCGDTIIYLLLLLALIKERGK